MLLMVVAVVVDVAAAAVEMMMKPLQMMMVVMVDEMTMKRERNRDYVCLDAGAGSLFSFTEVYNSNAHVMMIKSNNLYI